MVIYNAANTFFERFAAEVDEQPYGLAEKAKVGEKLFGVDGHQPFDRLDLDDKATVHYQICPERGREADAFKLDIDSALTLHCISHPHQTLGKDSFVNAFRAARAQGLDEGARQH